MPVLQADKRAPHKEEKAKEVEGGSNTVFAVSDPHCI